jgi:hypothetical protein
MPSASSSDCQCATDAITVVWQGQGKVEMCQGKVEMSPSRQSRNVVFVAGLLEMRVSLRVPVKRRRALVATNPIKE